MKCLNCEKEVVQKEGKREKKFCSDSCRATYHRKQKGGKSRWVDREKYQHVLKRITELENELSKKPQIQDLTKPTNVVKPPELPKSNFTVNTTYANSIEAVKEQIEADKLEVANLGSGSVATQRKHFLQKRIDRLNKELSQRL